ncbi:MAG: hypothetical protein DMF85_09685 [Acidobacteria bacterium]|nr:MAG: hypothetical protein DMF85_09685 [Acidobacteriota bacterium]
MPSMPYRLPAYSSYVAMMFPSRVGRSAKWRATPSFPIESGKSSRSSYIFVTVACSDGSSASNSRSP